MADHFYTTDANGEGSPLYGSEGVACYVFPAATSGTVPLYRWFKPGDHFYTIDPGGEKALAGGYKAEGVACYVFADADAHTIPLHRWYNPDTNDHFYTTNSTGELAASVGYVEEGVACHVHQDSSLGAIPFYRWLEMDLSDYCVCLYNDDGLVYCRTVRATNDAHAEKIAAVFRNDYNLHAINAGCSTEIGKGAC